MDADIISQSPGAVALEIEGLTTDLTKLLVSKRRKFSTLKDSDVPCRAGLYIIYTEEPLEAIYVGKASVKNKALGTADGLCFRVMKNHLAYQGDDNFVNTSSDGAGLYREWRRAPLFEYRVRFSGSR